MGEKPPSILKLLEGVAHARSGLHYLEAALRYVASGSSYVNNEDIVRALKEALDDEEATSWPHWRKDGLKKELKGIGKGD